MPCAAYDLLPTFCELVGEKTPKDCDGISLAPTLLGDKQLPHEFLYWEFPGYGGQQAVRMGNWKGVRQKLAQGRTQIELYDLATDPGEAKDVARAHPEVIERIAKLFETEHVPSLDFPLPAIDKR